MIEFRVLKDPGVLETMQVFVSNPEGRLVMAGVVMKDGRFASNPSVMFLMEHKEIRELADKCFTVEKNGRY